MYPGRFFMMPTGFNNGYMSYRNVGLLNKLLNGFKSFNWRGLISGTNKTLAMVNQTIPLIKEVRPIVNNVRSVVKITKALGKEKVVKKKAENSFNSYLDNKPSNTKAICDAPTFFI